jgi:DNA-binding IclR family transcriptional regulator
MNVDRSPTLIQSVRRAAAMLEVIARRPKGATATEAARELDIPLPTAHHLLNTLAHEGLLTKDRNRRYQLGPTVGMLAEAFLAQVSAPESLIDRVRELADRTGETAYLSGWRNGDAVLLSIIEGRRAVRVAGLHVGYKGAAHARASGKVLLAFASEDALGTYLAKNHASLRTGRTPSGHEQLRAQLDTVRAHGFALDEEEFAEGVACIAAPVADGSMAIGISVPVGRFREHGEALIRTVVAVATTAQTVRYEASGLCGAGR